MQGFYLKKCKVNLTQKQRNDILKKENVKQTLQEGVWEVAVKNRIEEIRKERGIRQEDFAKSMGVSRQTISSLENGRYNPSIILAYKIAQYFEMTIEEVFVFEDDDLK